MGIDLKTPTAFNSPNFRFIEADMETVDPETLKAEIGPKDVVLSDLAPATTGIRDTDAARSMFLAEQAARIGLALLRAADILYARSLKAKI